MARELRVNIVGDTSSYTRSLKTAERNTNHFNREISKTIRGAAAGTGAFKTLGRSLAFASGGFIAAAGITDIIRGSIEQAQQAAVAQQQLAAQFKASNLNLADYQSQIDKTTNSLSKLAGIEDDQVKAAFTLAFRATQDVQKGLRLTTIAADVARGRHIQLAQAVLALNKAYGGNTGALRRLGITIPKSLKGMQALEFVARRFAGQAEAGTTASDRFGAALVNMEQAIGVALLPAFDRLLTSATDWLSNTENQERVQRDVTQGVRIASDVLGGLKDSLKNISEVLQPLVNQLGGTKNAVKLLAAAFVGLKLAKLATQIRGIATAWGLVTTAAGEAAAAEAAAAGAGIGGVAGFRGRGIFGKILPGGLGAAGAAGAALAFAQRGELSRSVSGAQVLNDLVAYVDPVTGKRVLVSGYKGGDIKQFILRDVRKRHPDFLAPTAAGSAPRDQPGRAPGGPGAFFLGPTGTGGPGRLGFNARFARLELALTKAERTIQDRDNRAILVQEAALLRQRISKVKNMKDLLKLNQQLTGVVQQIQQIDDDQRQKELDARKAAADKARAHAAKLRAQAAAVKAQLQSALDSAITQMGQLFDVFVPDDPAKGILGVLGGGVTAKSLTAKLKKQTDQVVAFNRDLNRLAKRGAPPALIAALRAEGLPGAQNVHALATAGRADLNTFLRQYARRQRVAQQIAHADIRAKNVYINGNIRRTATTPTSQRRGRNAGVIDAAMMAGAGSPWS